MIPPFANTDELPPGIHWSDWTELELRFGFSNRRQMLLIGLKQGLMALKTAGCATAYIDGSFVSSKLDPGDADVCYEIAGMRGKLLDPVLLDFSNARAAQKAKYGSEFFPAEAAASPNGTQFLTIKRTFGHGRYLEFFQLSKNSKNKKGIVALDLKGLQP
jgi:hypothetical protein